MISATISDRIFHVVPILLNSPSNGRASSMLLSQSSSSSSSSFVVASFSPSKFKFLTNHPRDLSSSNGLLKLQPHAEIWNGVDITINHIDGSKW
ncbi:Pyridoxine/pyridoxamine 5'-phosphate oxidase [Bienertia sinuspersici]